MGAVAGLVGGGTVAGGVVVATVGCDEVAPGAGVVVTPLGFRMVWMTAFGTPAFRRRKTSSGVSVKFVFDERICWLIWEIGTLASTI